METKTKIIALLVTANLGLLFVGFEINKSNAHMLNEKPKITQKDKNEVKGSGVVADEEPIKQEKPSKLDLMKKNIEKDETSRLVWKNDAARSIDILVNAKIGLHADYRPDDLVPINVPFTNMDGESNTMREEAAREVEKMFADAEEEGLYLVGVSAFRSFERQQRNYNRDLNRYGQNYVDKYIAVPGTSEHQLGLVIDISSRRLGYDLVESFADTIEGQWLAEHSYKYGFIVRYPEDKRSIVGYEYEPWHFRYVGKELAKKIYDSGLTFEEYVDKQLKEE
ncbi:MAG: D-alanyl-D-alanine carboxypeptidase family protein [Bacillaceae bacterium]